MGSKYQGDPADIVVNNGGALNTFPTPRPQGKGGLFGSGMNGEGWINVLTRAAALAQGDYGGAAQLTAAMRKQSGDPEYERFVKEQEYKAAHPSPADPAPIERDAEAWARMTPEQRANFQALENIRQPHFERGPDGLYYPVASGAQTPPPAAPVGRLTPIPDYQGGAAPGAGGPFTGDIEPFRQAIIGQESGGRYGIPNAQGSGAMGIGQVMPGTAKSLAQRLGMPYRPDLMAGKDAASQQYQNAVTNAAVQEAWNAGNGDPATAAMYYYGGSDRNKWGPRTHRYADEILSRLRGA